MTCFSMEELVPLVADLTKRYTSNESTSIPYETARRLLGAVQYTIAEYAQYKDEDTLVIGDVDGVTLAKAQYELGQQYLLSRMQKLRSAYNEFLPAFESYENENYYDTVVGGIGGFLTHYDYRYDPQNTIITMDYPTLIPVTKQEGLDAVVTYFEYITLEQEFLKGCSKDYIFQVLTEYDEDYREQFYNIASVVLRKMLITLVENKKSDTTDELSQIEELVLRCSTKQLTEYFAYLVKQLVEKQYGGNDRLMQYLSADVPDFIISLQCKYGVR